MILVIHYSYVRHLRWGQKLQRGQALVWWQNFDIWTNLTFSNLNNNFCSNYRYDTRGEDKSYEEARHWSDDKVLTGRAFFRGDHDPGRLILDNVGAKDQGVYKCRVDFRKAPTRISNVNLNVIGEKTWRKQLENLRKTNFFLLTLSLIA